MAPVRRSVPTDAPVIAAAVTRHLEHMTKSNSYICADFNRRDFERSMGESAGQAWIDDVQGRARGHLYGATLSDPIRGTQTWTGPDGWSFHHEDVLDDLLACADAHWRSEGSSAHVVWVPAGEATHAWRERGYVPTSVRASLALEQRPAPALEYGWSIRQGGLTDLPTALAFDALIDLAQGVDVRSLSAAERVANENDLIETLDDPDSNYYLLERDHEAVAQCVTFPLPQLRGTFERTIYLSEVAVATDHRGRGHARTIVERALNDAAQATYQFAEVRWRADNEPAAALWRHLGFTPTFVQLRRAFSADLAA